MLTNYLSDQYKDLDNFILREKNNYINAEPFPHAVLNNLFNINMLEEFLDHFPEKLEDSKDSMDWNTFHEKKTTATPLQLKFNDILSSESGSSTFTEYSKLNKILLVS